MQVNPKAPDQLFVGLEGDGVFASDDAGETWAAANTCLMNTNIQGLAMQHLSSTTLYASTFGSVFKTRSRGFTPKPFCGITRDSE